MTTISAVTSNKGTSGQPLVQPSSSKSSSKTEDSKTSSKTKEKKSSCSSMLPCIALGTLAAFSAYYLGRVVYNQQVCQTEDRNFRQSFIREFSPIVNEIERTDIIINDFEKKLKNKDLTEEERARLQKSLSEYEKSRSKKVKKCKDQLITEIWGESLHRSSHCSDQDLTDLTICLNQERKSEESREPCYFDYLGRRAGSNYTFLDMKERVKDNCVSNRYLKRGNDCRKS
jgi:hypothetical protein